MTGRTTTECGACGKAGVFALPACTDCWSLVPAAQKTAFYSTRRAHEGDITSGEKLAAFNLATANAVSSIKEAR